MANAKIDQNYRRSLLAVLDDGSLTTEPVRANPITKRLLVSAVVTSNNTGIGNTIPGGTPGSVLFLDIGSTLAEDNDYFFYDPSIQSLAIGHNNPQANLHVIGTVRFDLGSDTTGDIYYRDSSGDLARLPIGTSGQLLTVAGGLPAWGSSSGSVGYDTIDENGASLIQRNILNFVNYFNVTDAAGKTNVDLDITAISSNLDLSSITGDINLSTQITGTLGVANGGTGATSLTGVLVGNGTSAISGTAISQGDLFYGSAAGTLSALPKNTSATRYLSNTGTNNSPAWALIDLSNGVTGTLSASNVNQSSLSLSSIGGQINLGTQVTGQLPLANGGTGANLTDPGANKLLGWDDTDNSVGFWTLGTGLTYTHATHTLSVSSTPSLYSVPDYDLVDMSGTGVKCALELSDGTFFIYTLTNANFNNYSISPDKTKVYKLTIAYTVGSNYNLTLEEYTGNGSGSIGTLATTYTGTSSHTVGNNNYEGGIFVNGSKLFVPLAANGSVSASYTEWTLSGTSLITPISAGMTYATTGDYRGSFYWFYDGTYYYIYNPPFSGLGNGRITRCSYASGVGFSPIASTPGVNLTGISSKLGTQSVYYIAVDNWCYMLLYYFKIEGGKVVNFCFPKLPSSTAASAVIVSGVLLANNVSAP